MSWRTGTKILLEVLPIIRKHMPAGEERRDFLKDLVILFLDNDIDPSDILGIDPEMDAIADEVNPEIP